MAESFNQTFIRAYRYIRSSPVRTALAVVVLVILLVLLFLGVQFVAQQRGSLALLNGLNLLLIPLLLIGAVVWLANTWKGTQMEMARPVSYTHLALGRAQKGGAAAEQRPQDGPAIAGRGAHGQQQQGGQMAPPPPPIAVQHLLGQDKQDGLPQAGDAEGDHPR